MTVIVSTGDTVFNQVVNNTFTTTTANFSSGAIASVAAFSGTIGMPEGSRATRLTPVTTVAGKWLAPSDGVSILGSPVVLTPTSSGAISFVRIYRGISVGFIDISCGLVNSGNSCIVSTLNAISGTSFSITDLRIRLACMGQVSVNPAIANFFVAALTGSATYAYSTAGVRAFELILKGLGTYEPIVIEIYNGAIPSRADQTPTGTLLWTKTLNAAGQKLFSTTNSASPTLEAPLTATAVASGIPTYCRVRRAAFTASSSGIAYPACILQVPVSNASSGCVVSDGTFTSGQSYTITNLTLTLNAS
jgi:hypothetical protein